MPSRADRTQHLHAANKLVLFKYGGLGTSVDHVLVCWIFAGNVEHGYMIKSNCFDLNLQSLFLLQLAELNERLTQNLESGVVLFIGMVAISFASEVPQSLVSQTSFLGDIPVAG